MLSVTSEQIEQALVALKKGQVIVFPTETSYGLGCDATNQEAVSKIFEIKGRERTKALPLIIPDKASASQFVILSAKAQEIADLFWPGPLNIIAPTQIDSPVVDACSENGTQSVRVSSHPFTSTLARRFGKPIVATSANISGRDAVYRVADVKHAFSECSVRPDVFIDGGDLPHLPASTSVIILNDQVGIVRQGGVQIPEKFL